MDGDEHCVFHFSILLPDKYIHVEPCLIHDSFYLLEFFKNEASILARSFSARKILFSARSRPNPVICYSDFLFFFDYPLNIKLYLIHI